MTNEVLSTLVFNHMKDILEVCAITVPGMGNYSKLIIEDFAIATNALFIDE